ncbi:SMP-30/gluconolactonase/LRE family protein [Phenylobacterium hankyongense]|uniref:SMP-30/gluconolactonase/LRE family protein n=1 Tax=Phenylobacterium hankyongense TaxID=1813876 RepID=A0A328AUI9_9CAUL|nr:SMP-30/gluconolactonase/LRE family protein [Phenylobacterium hankyongense]RAK58693.1 SMP-30/gluconolactonase/LRE family protein [Phenylobacterium hankyongense]
MDYQLVAEGLEFPEGPIALADGSVVLTEIKGQRLTRVAPDGRKEILVETGGGPNGAAIGPDGAIWITNNGGSFEWLDTQGLTIPGPTPASHTGGMIQRYDLATRELTTVYEACEGRRLIGPNDLVFDRQGGFWFTDHGCSTPEGRKFGGLYYAKTDGSMISRQRDHLISPNGVGLSPDESVVYAADTQLGRLWAFDIAQPGVLAPPPGFAPGRVVHNLEGYQLLDSLAVEASGKVCVATIINGGITAFDPSGSVEHYPFPDLVCTNICFGGADMTDAWITASSTGKLYKARWPRPGLKLNFNA